MGRFVKAFGPTSNSRYESVCKGCGSYVQVDTDPAPNGIDIGGTAVALNCKGKK